MQTQYSPAQYDLCILIENPGCVNVNDKVINFKDAKSPHDHARKEHKLEDMRARFKAASNLDKPKTKAKKKKTKRKKSKKP